MTAASPTTHAPTAVLHDIRPDGEGALVHAFVLLPMLALVAAVPLAWGWGLSWLDVGLAVGFYFLSGFGITVGFHRYFTQQPSWIDDLAGPHPGRRHCRRLAGSRGRSS